jgi:tetratricopeptide (TPR) repeat protein
VSREDRALKKETFIIAVMALVIVVLGGVLIFKLSHKNEEMSTPAAVPTGSGSPVDYQQRIAELEKVVAGDPKNFQAWTMLANDYYDTDQPQKAIEAYGKALELSPNNPNLLTDQGVMYKRLGENHKAQGQVEKARTNFENALANFQKAQKIDPKHMQSLYNLGIVYAEDLNQPENALKVWKHYLELDSTSPVAQQVKRMIAQTGAAVKGGAK